MNGSSIYMRRVTRKGKVNRSEVLDVLTKLGMVVLNVFHVVDK